MKPAGFANTLEYMKMSATIIKQGETFSKVTRIETEDLVTVRRATAWKGPQKGAEIKAKYACEWQFDYENVTRDELLKLATDSMVIDVQSKFRTIPESQLNDECEKTISVREWLDSKRQTVSQEEKARKALAALDPETRAALLASMK